MYLLIVWDWNGGANGTGTGSLRLFLILEATLVSSCPTFTVQDHNEKSSAWKYHLLTVIDLSQGSPVAVTLFAERMPHAAAS